MKNKKLKMKKNSIHHFTIAKQDSIIFFHF